LFKNCSPVNFSSRAYDMMFIYIKKFYTYYLKKYFNNYYRDYFL
jgi:hypothetical protein